MFLLAQAGQAHAGASLSVDDAAVTPRGRCQMDAWGRAYAPGQEYTAVPACNWGGTEVGLGVSHYGHPSLGPLANLGLKRLFRDFDRHRWGVGASLGATWNGATDRLDAWNINVPASVALDAQRRWVAHANLGWADTRGARAAVTLGVGIERALAGRWTLLAEAYGDHRGGSGGQVGLRRACGKNATLDVLVGHQDGLAHAPWVTLGFGLLFPD